MEDILRRFENLLDETISKGEKKEMELSRTMFKRAVFLLAQADEKKANDFVECFEGSLRFHNYLSRGEAMKVVEAFVNQDGSRGPIWRDTDEFFAFITSIGGNVDSVPHYNKWALYATANKFASDQHSVIVKWVGGDKTKYTEACYELAVSQLEDKDFPNWVRWYFGVYDE